MENPDNPSEGAAEKPAAKPRRTRTKTAPAAAATTAPKRTRARKAATAPAEAELPLSVDAPIEPRPAPAAPAPEPKPAPAEAVRPGPSQQRRGRGPVAPEPAPTPIAKSEPAPVQEPAREPVQAATPAPAEERPVFKPQAAPVAPAAPAEVAQPAQQAPAGDRDEPAPSPVDRSDSDVGGAPAEENGGGGRDRGRRESFNGGPQDGGQGGDDREPWWKRKKDKKKQKWLEKKQGGGHGGGGGRDRDRGPQHPQQPPPPNLAPRIGDMPDPQRFADGAIVDAMATELEARLGEAMSLGELYALSIGELGSRARGLGLTFEGVPSRKQLLDAIFRHAGENKIPFTDRGWLDLTDRGHGFLVHDHVNYRLYPEDAYVPEALIKRYGLKRGHQLEILAQAPQPNERCPSVVRVTKVMGGAPETAASVVPFEELVPYYPLKRILLEAPEIHKDISMRAIDLLTPVGFGQRGLIVAPPRTGKTVLLQNIANSVSQNFPDVKLILLLIDERPEEVTDFRRHTKGEVVSSTFDESPENHVHAAEMVIERARRMVELGQHVVILLDSITRLARAYNALASNSGKIMSGGVEATALQRPKRFFGSARNIEGGGSITILGTALIDTGSRMDEVIFEEFKGTGNMELHLDRGLSDKRIFPAINIDRSGTRKEELIYHPDEMQRVYGLRRAMQGIPPVEAMDMFIQRLKKTKTNAEFLLSLR